MKYFICTIILVILFPVCLAMAQATNQAGMDTGWGDGPPPMDYTIQVVRGEQ